MAELAGHAQLRRAYMSGYGGFRIGVLEQPAHSLPVAIPIVPKLPIPQSSGDARLIAPRRASARAAEPSYQDVLLVRER
jgi:hypothetical protein